jgi:LAS superfamily LD-carboxypeptidase LdcB
MACLDARVVAAHGEPLEDTAASSVRAPRLDCTSKEAVGYQRGKAVPISVVHVDDRPVEQRTANAYWAMRDAAARDGVSLDIRSGFRTNAQQASLYACYLCCCCNGCTLAAKPGFSNHQSGRALDLKVRDEATLPWLLAHASRFGFVATVRNEPWHWEYRGSESFDDICADT